RTYCRICMTCCGLAVDLDETSGRIVKVKGDFDHPISKGYTCPKGRSIDKVLHRPNPVTHPMMRKDGVLVEVSWDEALDDVAAKLRKTIDAHGPHAVGMYFGSGLGIDSAGYTMMEAFHAALDGPPKFSPLTNDGAAKPMLGAAMAGTHAMTPRTDYDAVELLIYIGTNPMVSHAHNTGMTQPGMWIKQVMARGEVWTLDPLSTETTRMSTRHIQPYPGKDYWIFAWILQQIIDHGPVTPKQKVQGLDELRAALDGVTLARAAEISGVPESDIVNLLAAIRRHGKCAIETGTGVTMSVGCNITHLFAWTIMVLTGSMNARGGAWFHPGAIHQFETFDLPILDSAFTPGPKTRPDVTGILGEWPCAVLPPEIEAGNIRALFNFGGHIIRSFPDTNALSAALPKLEFHVNTEIAHTESTAFATHILPPKYGLERHELIRWDTLGWNVNLQYSPPLVEPMGDRRSAWWILSQIMSRAGLPVPDYLPESDLVPGADEYMLSRLMQHARCSFEELQEKRIVEFPMEFPADWVERHFERLGGWRLAVPELLGQWQKLRGEDEAFIGRNKPLVYTSRRQRRKFNGQVDFFEVPADIILHPETAAERGIEHGQKVRVYNKSGEIFLTAVVDPGARRGICSIPHGHEHANVNLLTSADDMDLLTGMALYTGVTVEAEPAIDPLPRNWDREPA
ncbi:MAG: molybdopterin-dependent oxidoreductase, partial [Novosphingobium sp.]